MPCKEEEKSSIKENAQTARAEDFVFGAQVNGTNVACWLAREWDTYSGCTRLGGIKREDATDALPVMQELLRRGVTEAVLLAELRSKQRDRTEYLWQFKKRMLPTGRADSADRDAKFLARG